MKTTFRPSDFLYQGGNSISLKQELEKYNMEELKEIYKTITWGDFRENATKEDAINQIVQHTLRFCNRGRVMSDGTGKVHVIMPYR